MSMIPLLLHKSKVKPRMSVNKKDIVKTSSSESRPKKVELASAHKNVTTTVSILHIITKLVKTPTKQPYCFDIFIS